MDSKTWWSCYEKLTKAFGKPRDPEQSSVYFEALQGVPGPTMRLAVQHAIRDAKHWPNVATLRDYCTTAGREVAAPASMKCEECDGSTWVPAPAIHENGLVHENVVKRCPSCWTLAKSS